MSLKYTQIQQRVFQPAGIHHARNKSEYIYRKNLFEIIPLKIMDLVSRIPLKQLQPLRGGVKDL